MPIETVGRCGRSGAGAPAPGLWVAFDVALGAVTGTARPGRRAGVGPDGMARLVAVARTPRTAGAARRAPPADGGRAAPRSGAPAGRTGQAGAALRRRRPRPPRRAPRRVRLRDRARRVPRPRAGAGDAGGAGRLRHPAHGLRRLHAAPAGRPGPTGRWGSPAAESAAHPPQPARPGPTPPPPAPAPAPPAATDARRPRPPWPRPSAPPRGGPGGADAVLARPGAAGAGPRRADRPCDGVARRVRRARQRPPPWRPARGRAARPRGARGGGAGGGLPGLAPLGQARPAQGGQRRRARARPAGPAPRPERRRAVAPGRRRPGRRRPPATAGDPPELERVALRAEVRLTLEEAGLSRKEAAVWTLGALGHTRRQIAAALGSAPGTVASQKARATRKLWSYTRLKELLRGAGHPAPAASEAGRTGRQARPGRPRRTRRHEFPRRRWTGNQNEPRRCVRSGGGGCLPAPPPTGRRSRPVSAPQSPPKSPPNTPSTSFVALYRGPTITEARLIAVSADPAVVARVAAQLLRSAAARPTRRTGSRPRRLRAGPAPGAAPGGARGARRRRRTTGTSGRAGGPRARQERGRTPVRNPIRRGAARATDAFPLPAETDPSAVRRRWATVWAILGVPGLPTGPRGSTPPSRRRARPRRPVLRRTRTTDRTRRCPGDPGDPGAAPPAVTA